MDFCTCFPKPIDVHSVIFFLKVCCQEINLKLRHRRVGLRFFVLKKILQILGHSLESSEGIAGCGGKVSLGQGATGATGAIVVGTEGRISGVIGMEGNSAGSVPEMEVFDSSNFKPLLLVSLGNLSEHLIFHSASQGLG